MEHTRRTKKKGANNVDLMFIVTALLTAVLSIFVCISQQTSLSDFSIFIGDIGLPIIVLLNGIFLVYFIIRIRKTKYAVVIPLIAISCFVIFLTSTYSIQSLKQSLKREFVSQVILNDKNDHPADSVPLFWQKNGKSVFTNNGSSKTNFKNFYGITWRGEAHDNLVFARNMKYDYVFYQDRMEYDPLSNGLYFYVESPEYLLYQRRVSIRKTHSPKAVEFYNKFCALKDTTSHFPFNLATGWYFDRYTFTPLLDFQQEKVIKWAVDSIMKRVAKIEKTNPNFHFGGFAWDEPRVTGDFWEYSPPDRKPATMETWNTNGSGALAKGNSHEFKTYLDGRVAYYKQLISTAKSKYKSVSVIHEPYYIYDHWFKDAVNQPDVKSFWPDILSQEGFSTAFINDKRIYVGGLFKKTDTYCTTPDVFDEAINRKLAGIAAVNGAGFGWFGRFGGTGNMPDFKNIFEVPARLQLIRCLTMWENKNGVPLDSRRWVNGVYSSPFAFISPDVIAIVKPGTSDLFVVFLTLKGVCRFANNKRIKSISSTDQFFRPKELVTSEFDVTENSIRPRFQAILDKGYIIRFDDK